MRHAHARPLRAAVAVAVVALAVTSLAACGSDDPGVAVERSTERTDRSGTPTTVSTTTVPTTTVPGSVVPGSVVPGSVAPVATAVVPGGAAPMDTTTTSTTLVGPDLPTTTIPGRRLYTVTGTLGVFPVAGTICAMDVAGAAGTLVAPDGSVVDEPEVGTISYGGEISFAATTSSEGTFQYSISAYATAFTGNGTYSISWIDNRRSGYMELTEASGHASNPVVDEDDTSDQEMIFSVVASGTC